MFSNIFNDKAIEELANILVKQDVSRIEREVLKEIDIKLKGIDKKLEISISKALL